MVAALITLAMYLNREKTALETLPQDATNVVRHRLSPNYFCEFYTSETGFRTWVDSQTDPVMGPVSQQVSSILRWNPSSKETYLYRIENALVADWTGEQPDEGQHMVYDLATRKAYFWYHSR